MKRSLIRHKTFIDDYRSSIIISTINLNDYEDVRSSPTSLNTNGMTMSLASTRSIPLDEIGLLRLHQNSNQIRMPSSKRKKNRSRKKKTN